MGIVVEFEPIWFIIFFWTVGLSSVCIVFGFHLLSKKPKRYSSASLGLFFIGSSINFFAYPFIILSDIFACLAYKIQVIGYMLSIEMTFIFGRSLTRKPSIRFLLVTSISSVLIIFIVWVIIPFRPIPVSYGYELNIDPWFFGFLGTYGYSSLIYLVFELLQIYKKTIDNEIRRRVIYIIGGYISLVISMTLLLTVLPITFNSAEIKPFGLSFATICIIILYYGYRKGNTNSNREIH
ncbi:MAG: hypothetical protein ACFFD2_00940 [Promethearchaeota archaeon]